MSEWNRSKIQWRQGCLVCIDADSLHQLAGTIHQLTSTIQSQDRLLIIASHDCDIAQCPDVEPMVEVIVGCLVPSMDGSYTHSKNPRKLHIEFAGITVSFAEFEAKAKISICKSDLTRFKPRTDAILSPENLAIFQAWLSSRYRRSAFPDEFECRLKATKLNEKIAKAVRPHSDLIIGVFFDVDDGIEVIRDGSDNTYTLDIIILYQADSPSGKAEKAANAAANEIKKAFEDKLFWPTKQWQEIELRSCDPTSESELTYSTFKILKRWRLDHISLSADPQHHQFSPE